MTTSVLDEIRSLVPDLSLADRLQLIRELATLPKPPKQTPTNRTPEERSQRKEQLSLEQKQWFARPLQERQQYSGQYVAVYQNEVVDSDVDQRQLYLRVRQRFGHQPVLLIPADLAQTPVYTLHSPQVSY